MINIPLNEKIHRMFILGLEGGNLEQNPGLINALNNNLGGVIFFTQNISSADEFKKLISDIKRISKSPLFLSIDQEGGRVERTQNIHNGTKYLSAKDSAEKGEEFVKEQTFSIASELINYGLNMNFAPVLDVNTNPHNPIIAERAYASTPEDVIKFAKIAFSEYINSDIIPVGKHFPGHGFTDVDSHKKMPETDLSLEELQNTHIKPFEELIKAGLPAIMAAHIHYTAFDKQKIPGSISKNVLGYLRNKLCFNGLIISDDMVMGGIKEFSPLDACTKGINAGINMFIFRNSDAQTLELIENLTLRASRGEINIDNINKSVKLIQSTLRLAKAE